ncbi:MAG: hypothetical protein LBH46_03635 [Rickettsiales bacterium]|jgi:hypothetical protein|nr:hypothetical protein [Rickettsiales bacterium]
MIRVDEIESMVEKQKDRILLVSGSYEKDDGCVYGAVFQENNTNELFASLSFVKNGDKKKKEAEYKFKRNDAFEVVDNKIIMNVPNGTFFEVDGETKMAKVISGKDTKEFPINIEGKHIILDDELFKDTGIVLNVLLNFLLKQFTKEKENVVLKNDSYLI